MKGKIFSPGKLLLTSEYVVLDGALALAIPTKWGQEFFFEEVLDGQSCVNWTALHEGQPWLNAQIDYKKGNVLSANLPDAAAFILKVLMRVKERSEVRLNNNSSYSITTNLQFPANFGLGSSSTLMTNIAEWAGIDAFDLNESCLGGSGYDIAVAKEKTALLYQNLKTGREVQTVTFDPPFKDDLIFVHLNKKQNSREGIDLYRSREKSPDLIREFSELTLQIFKAQNLEDFSQLMTLHEKKLSSFLQIETVKDKYFEKCPVFFKSLGAWGGDFVLSSKFPGFEAYFRGQGFATIFEWKALIS